MPRPRRPRLAVDLAAALGLTGTLIKYLSISALVPAAVAIVYGESPWPFVAAAVLAAAVGFGLERIGARAGTSVGFRRGISSLP